jgi:hypothetical protein
MTPYYNRGTRWIAVASTAACQVRTDEAPPIVARAHAPATVICSASAAVKLTTMFALNPQRVPVVNWPPTAATAADRPHAPSEVAPKPVASETPAPAGAGPFDLVIEELPNHRLYQPIPVKVQPTGDDMFCASVPELTLSVTGTSISDALLLLKAEIVSGYAEIEKKTTLDAAEKEQLKFYYSHIVKDPPTPEFVSARGHGASSGSRAASRWIGRW